jgi:hypothetical protein
MLMSMTKEVVGSEPIDESENVAWVMQMRQRMMH